MDKYIRPKLHRACDYLNMLGLKLNHVRKRGRSRRQERNAMKIVFELHKLKLQYIENNILYRHALTSDKVFIEWKCHENKTMLDV